jgi:ribosomal protein S18 acetylase RimI-like enzyme
MTSAPEVVFQPLEVQTRLGRTLWAREYTVDDFGALVEMYKGFEPKRVAQGLPPPDVPRIARWLDELQRKSRALLALDGPRIVGHALLCPISDATVEFTIFVHQDYREKGLGTELTRLAIGHAREMGFAEISLTTELTNFPALRLYRKVGFEILSSYGDECEMHLRIAARRAARPRAA